jgi:hypothetical protein
VSRVNRATRQGEGVIFWNLSERSGRADGNRRLFSGTNFYFLRPVTTGRAANIIPLLTHGGPGVIVVTMN